MFRVQLTQNSTNKNPIAEKVILVKDFDSLKKQASQKFKINPSKLRLFVAKTVINAKVGVEISNEDDLQTILNDDIMLAVSNGEDFKRKVIKTKEITEDVLNKLRKPPKYPFPGNILGNKLIQQNASVQETEIQQTVNNQITFLNPKETNYQKEFNENNSILGTYPILKGNVLQLVKQITGKYDKIIKTESNGFISFDYDDNMIFSEMESWDDALIRECRGLIISTVTGKVLARRFHKFFNIGEKLESNCNEIDFDGAYALEKLDGTLTSPVLLDNNEMVWATRKVRSLEIENFVNTSDMHTHLDRFCRHFLNNNITPLFEYCHDSTPVAVLRYPFKQLVLIALRNMETGEYLNLSESLDFDPRIRTTDRIHFTNINQLFKDVKSSVNREGVVIYTKNGNLYKLKSEWYVTMVNSQTAGKMFLPEFTKTTGTLQNVPKDKLFGFALHNYDDAIAQTCMNLQTNNKLNEAKELRKFVQMIQKNVLVLEAQLKEWLLTGFKAVQDKDVVLTMAENAGWDTNMLNEIYEGKSITNKLKMFIMNFANLGKLEVVSQLLDIDWNSDNMQVDLGNQVLNIITFDSCPSDIVEHVMTKYLPKKLCNMFGQKNMFNNTIINIPSSYVGSEGKIIGMYELFAEKHGIIDLRIDLQSPRNQYTAHNGNSEYALFVVQHGKTGEKSSEFAGIMVPTDSDYCYSDIVTAFTESFTTSKIIKLKRKPVLDSNRKVFCDLDGVLVDFDKGILDLTGRPVGNQTTSKMWQRVANCPDFFEKLDWTTYGKDMWKSIIEITQATPVILTGVPSSTKRRYDVEKKNWCVNNLSADIEVITCNSSDKYKYASDGYILIDDRLEMGRMWTASGGLFIHHVRPERTLYELKKIFGSTNLIKQDLPIVPTELLNTYVSNGTEVVIVTSVWPNILAEGNNIISIDSEWKHDSDTNSIAIVQICIPDINIGDSAPKSDIKNKVYIVDMINCSEIVIEQLQLLLLNKNITKLCFGIEEAECFRIGSDIVNVIDIQEICKDNYSNFTAGFLPSLSLCTASLLRKKLDKSKSVSLSDWSIRPLTPEQLSYASDDVTVLFELYEELKHFDMPVKNIYNPQSMTIKKNKTEFNSDIPVTICLSGIFLNYSSKKELLSLVKPIYPNVVGDYAVLRSKPTENELRGLNIGDTVEFSLVEEFVHDNMQIVKCKYANTYCFIMLSSHTTLYDVSLDSINVSTLAIVDNDAQLQSKSIISTKLFGIIGVLVQQEQDDLILLSEKIRNKIKKFKEDAQPNENLKFKPGELSASERSAIHEYAKNNNMTSESSGKTTDRQLILTKKRNTENSNLKELISNDDKQKIKIVDSHQYLNLKIISDNDTLNNYIYDGKITENVIEVTNDKLNKLLGCKPKLIVLRGLPGSGKSFLTNYFANDNAEICSADDYFEKNGKYEFDPNQLQKAHDFTYNTCIEYLHKRSNTVIIDNTNSTLREYKKYIEAANCFGYITIVLEVYCKNRDQANEFAKRCTHNVPTNDCLKMLARWETDDSSYKLKPFGLDNKILLASNDKTLHHWLTEKKLYHYSKIRNKSHMLMSIGDRQATFLDVSDNLYDEFCYKYAEAIMVNEPLYIMEYCNRYDKFRMFIDFDYADDTELPKDKIIEYVKVLQSLLIKDDNYADVYVTGCISQIDLSVSAGKTKTGLHFRCPNYMVTKEEAVNLATAYINKLNELNGSKSWNTIVDTAVYRENCGIKMIGSRKVTNGIDVGRVHTLILGLDENGNEFDVSNISPYEMVKILSIYNK